MNRPFAVGLVLFTLLSHSSSAQAAKDANLQASLGTPGGVVLEQGFSGQKLDPPWVISKGNWLIQDGVVVGREKKEDMHAAVLTLQQPHSNSIIRFSFKLDGATGFNLSFNNAKGHLFRIAVNPTGVVVSKDKDKKDPASKSVQLGKAAGTFGPGQWHTILVETNGQQVGVLSDNGLKLDVHDPSLAVNKTGYRFVIRGESISLDDVHIWKVEPK